MEDGEFIQAPGNVYDARSGLISMGLAATDCPRNLQTGIKRSESGDDGERVYGMRVLWCLGCLGNRKAAGLYADAVESHVSRETMPEAQASHFLAVAANWRRIADDDFDLAALMATGSVHAASPSTVADDGGDGIPPQTFGSPIPESPRGFTVLHAVGDPLSSEGRGIASRFQPIIGKDVRKAETMPAQGALSEFLLADFPWAVEAIGAVERSLDIIRDSGSPRSFSKPLLLVGKPGSGKTTLAMEIGRALGRHTVRLPAAGTADAATLNATPRGWSNFRPSLPAMAMLESQTCDPCLVIDELDKASTINSQHGSVQGALMGMLDMPAEYYDTALMANVDISNVLFIATANGQERINEALRDRFTVIPVGQPGGEHFDRILSRMRRDMAARLEVDPAMLPMLDGVEYEALQRYFLEGRGAGGSLRNLLTAYEIVLRSALARERSASMAM